ncbi:hypothetical protein DEO72_LG7g585 [Vigna unguiculata]|uniref:Uncharacterized protein n=1 Tax=Vigna unguiculata TaxID=3917 RepID=A0A4D6MHU7_VIGUN|nr:hypothetical protein DEO72_LG7g585 [Vigna unguiculata]
MMVVVVLVALVGVNRGGYFVERGGGRVVDCCSRGTLVIMGPKVMRDIKAKVSALLLF